MRFSVLGPLSVSLDTGPVSLGGRKQRMLLAMLLLHANEVVSRDQLIDALWGERPPASATESLIAYLYRLRKLLGHDRLPREAGGYLLRVEPDELDADLFEGLVASARRDADDGEHGGAVNALTEALGLWRGLAWADMLDDPSLGAEAQRLEELRLGALESRTESELALGGGTQLVPELEQLVKAHPLRERLLAGLMLALYRAGRQADALEVFQVGRKRLIEEFGLEPGPDMYELQRRILQHDPSLAAPRRFPQVSGSRGRRTFAVPALLALVAVVVGGFVLGAGAASPRQLLAPGVSGVVAISARSDRVVAATALAGTPAAITTGASTVWVADASNGGVWRIDPASGAEQDRIPIGDDPASIASGNGAIWVASADGATVVRINPVTETVTQRIPLAGDNPDALAFGAGRLWVADSTTRSLYVFDGTTGGLQRTIPLGISPSAVVFAAGAVWVAGYDSGTLTKVDAAEERVQGRVHVGTGTVSLAFADGDLWAANSLDSTVSRIDPMSLMVRAAIPVGSGPGAVIANAGSVWVANQYSGNVSRIDPRRDAVVATVAVGGMPTSLTPDGGRLWVGIAATSGSHRGGTFVVASAAAAASVDPAFYSLAEPTTFGGSAYDTLVTFDHTGGVGGLRLVPDLAETLPTPTDAGRTYAFLLRPGLHYSNGTLVRATDFRRAIERLFRVRSPGSGYYTSIAGAAGCVRRPFDCNLARGIVPDDATGTIVFHLSAPDPEFLDQLTEEDYTAPVPPGTPDRDMGLHPIPGTGPYRIARADATGIRFVRNPFFREWSHAAQPDGNPGTSRLAQWRHPVARVSPDRCPISGPTALTPALRDRIRATQHALGAVQPHRGETGAQLRDRSDPDRPHVRRTRVREAYLPAARPGPARLPSVLPVQLTPQAGWGLHRP
jgi:YVTN family beta-propeller protein